MRRLLDWRMRHILRRLELPDLPEVRAYMRACYWNGFTLGANERRIPVLRQAAFDALARRQVQLNLNGAWADITAYVRRQP